MSFKAWIIQLYLSKSMKEDCRLEIFYPLERQPGTWEWAQVAEDAQNPSVTIIICHLRYTQTLALLTEK